MASGLCRAVTVLERIRAYRTAAASASHTRKTYYVEVDGVLEESDFRQGARGPYGREPSVPAQKALMRTVEKGLTMAKNLQSDEVE